jgi:hypothetical protein
MQKHSSSGFAGLWSFAAASSTVQLRAASPRPLSSLASLLSPSEVAVAVAVAVAAAVDRRSLGSFDQTCVQNPNCVPRDHGCERVEVAAGGCSHFR